MLNLIHKIGYKKVIRFEDTSVGLRGFIAIHNTNLGSATGGTRVFPYISEEDALQDVLRLSRAMTYKCSIAGVPHGGGKGVIIGNPEVDKTPKLLKAYTKVLNELNGEFTTGEDSGVSLEDVQFMKNETRFINGANKSGDPSSFAALTVFNSMRSALRERLDTDSFINIRVAMKGVGNVGFCLVQKLIEAGASVIVADIRQSTLDRVKNIYPSVRIEQPDVIHEAKADIFSPCDMGMNITERNISSIPCSIICGAANNQLADPSLGDQLSSRGILYAPDYVANAGGLINVVDELEEGGYNRDRVMDRIQNLDQTLKIIFRLSREKNISPHRIADQMAEKRFLGR